MRITAPNSGGYGDPLERDPAAVVSDVLDGFTTLEEAERNYAIVIDQEMMAIDADATERLRKERAPTTPAAQKMA